MQCLSRVEGAFDRQECVYFLCGSMLPHYVNPAALEQMQHVRGTTTVHVGGVCKFVVAGVKTACPKSNKSVA